MRTKRISTRQAAPGMIVAEDIFNYSNQLVISSGTELTDKIITRLKFYCISELKIALEEVKKPETHKKPAAPSRSESSYTQMIKESEEFKKFNDTFLHSVKDFKGDLEKLKSDEVSIDVDQLLNYTNGILSNSRNGIHVFDMLHCMREYDDLTFVHSINVALLCNVFGHWLKLSEEDINILTISGLLHDIGKLSLPSEIINKPGKLTNTELITVKTHTIYGYQVLKDKKIDQRIKNVALMHHERCDGSGYPKGLNSSQIDSFAKIVSIVDVYDAMTSARVYRPALSPFEAISIFESEGLQKFDPHYIMTFLEKIIQAYVGNRVRLNNKLEGEIRMINKQHLSKPVVQVGNEFIDLSKEQDLYIETIL